MSASAIKMGGVFVEIGADPKKFFAALNRVNKSLANMGKSLVSGGTKLTAAGVGMAAPIVAAVRQGARFESVLLGIRASTGATAAEIDKIKAASIQMSQALGVGPTEAAGGMLELLKAGMSLESVLGGAGQAALQFAKVGEMDVAQAAVVMSDAMNVFGVSGTHAANTMSAAADASSTSIAQMAEAFSMSSAVAGLANQSIDDLSATLAILANAGVKGSDAGTSVKTMLMRLMAPADDAAKAMAEVGLSVDAFRGADGKMKPMVEIIGTLNQAMGGLDQTAKDDIFRRIFGADAIRAASILSAAGVDGFQGMRNAMAQALPVGEKFKILMSGMAGAGSRILAALERVAIAVSGALAPALKAIVPFIEGALNGFAEFATQNKDAVVTFAKVAASAIGVGGAMVGLGYALQGLSGAISLVLRGFGLFAALANPIVLVAAGIGLAVVGLYKFKDQIGAALGSVAPLAGQAAGAIGQVFSVAIADATVVFSDLYSIASTTFSGIYDAIAAGDLSGAMDILWAGLQAGWLRGVEALMSYVDPWIAAFQDAFTVLGAELFKTWDMLWVAVGGAFNTFGAYLQGAFDNVINGVLAAWDTLEAGIRKSWNYIQSFFREGFDLKAENNKVDSEMSARRRKRELERPGIEGRTARAEKENAQAEKDRRARADAVDANTQDTINQREQANQTRADERRANTQAAEANLNNATGNAAGKRQDQEIAKSLIDELGRAQTVDDLSNIGLSISALIDRDLLTGEVQQQVMDAYNAAASRILGSDAAGANLSVSPSEKAATAGASAAGMESQQSQGNVVGTFSSLNLGAAFGGTTAAERTAKATEEIARNTRNMDGARVAA